MNSSWIPEAKCKLSLNSAGGCYPDWRVHMLSKLRSLWYLNWALTFAESPPSRQRLPGELMSRFYLCWQRSDTGGRGGLATVFSHLRLRANGRCFPVPWSHTKSISGALAFLHPLNCQCLRRQVQVKSGGVEVTHMWVDGNKTFTRVVHNWIMWINTKQTQEKPKTKQAENVTPQGRDKETESELRCFCFPIKKPETQVWSVWSNIINLDSPFKAGRCDAQ